MHNWVKKEIGTGRRKEEEKKRKRGDQLILLTITDFNHMPSDTTVELKQVP